MKLSVAMATFNGAQFLRDQLTSLLAQARRPDELIISDDASEDLTLDVVNTVLARAPFEVRVIKNKKRLGYVKNFELALQHCTGDIVFLSDQDDVWLPEKLETLAHTFTANPHVFVAINDAQLVTESLATSSRTVLQQVHALGLGPESFITGCCTAFRKRFLPVICPIPDGEFVHDTWLHSLAMLLDTRHVIPRVLQLYRRHGRNASQWIGTRTTELGIVDSLTSYMPHDPRYWCQRRISQMALLEERISSCRAYLEQVLDGPSRVDLAIARIADIRHASQERLGLLRRGRAGRLVPAVRMLASGHYKHFSGWKSFLKDVVLS